MPRHKRWMNAGKFINGTPINDRPLYIFHIKSANENGKMSVVSSHDKNIAKSKTVHKKYPAYTMQVA